MQFYSQLISLTIIFPRFIHVMACVKFIYFYDWITIHFIYILHFACPLVHCWTFEMAPSFGCYVWCCYKYTCTNFCVHLFFLFLVVIYLEVKLAICVSSLEKFVSNSLVCLLIVCPMIIHLRIIYLFEMQFHYQIYELQTFLLLYFWVVLSYSLWYPLKY